MIIHAFLRNDRATSHQCDAHKMRPFSTPARGQPGDGTSPAVAEGARRFRWSGGAHTAGPSHPPVEGVLRKGEDLGTPKYPIAIIV